MPKLFIIAGCNGSGKTTASYSLLPEMLECSEFVNSDEFAKSLSPFNPSAVSVTASRLMLKKIFYLLDKKSDFSIETTLATKVLTKIVQQTKEKGYTVTLLYFWLNSPDLAMERVRKRVMEGGHNIPEDVIRRRYVMGLKYFFKTYSHICDKWILADNSQQELKIIAEGEKQNTVIIDAVKYQKIWNIAHDIQ